MEGHSYVSCIKINGIPILPPMVCILIILFKLFKIYFMIEFIFYR